LRHPFQLIFRLKEREIFYKLITQHLHYENTYLEPTITKNSIGNNHPDELDLINLAQKTVSFIIRFRIILLSFFLAGLTLGLYFYFSSNKQFTTRLIVHSMFLSNQEEIEIINNWKSLLSKRERAQLANIMNCRKEVVEKLSTISAEEILKTYAVNNPNGFLINVSVTDISILDDLQEGIVYGLNNSPYVKEKIAIRKAKDSELIKKTAEEIAKLNFTTTAIDSLIQTKHANTTPVMVDISRINASWIDLNEKLLFYQEDLRFLTGVQVLENFNKGKLVRSGLMKFSFLGMSAGFFIGYLISLLVYVRLKMKTGKTGLTTS
jgi:hypothetical protein